VRTCTLALQYFATHRALACPAADDMPRRYHVERMSPACGELAQIRKSNCLAAKERAQNPNKRSEDKRRQINALKDMRHEVHEELIALALARLKLTSTGVHLPPGWRTCCIPSTMYYFKVSSHLHLSVCPRAAVLSRLHSSSPVASLSDAIKALLLG
jgi:hypothetical protein